MTKLDEIFDFLQNNRKYPLEIQVKFREDNLALATTNSEKAYALLHDAYNTQTQVRLNLLAKCFPRYAENVNSKGYDTFEDFREKFKVDKNKSPYHSLFQAFTQQEESYGWGKKTTALFLKTIYQIHHLPKFQRLKFWNDVPTISKEDKLFLPVDAVILAIFNQVDGLKRKDDRKHTFDSINNLLKEKYNSESIEVWDDLWFWGFITQNSKDKETKQRKFIDFNEGKYWSQKHCNKNPNEIEKIKELCVEFLCVLGVSYTKFK